MDIQDVIRDQVTNNDVVLYMKGTPQFPQCGFSSTAVQILKGCGVREVLAVNVLADNEAQERIRAARARLGVAPGEGRALFYATGGAGYARIDHSFSTSNGANSFTPDNERDWQFGWQAGGGAEVMLTRNLGLGIEYLYSRFNDDDYVVAVGPGTAPATNPFLLESGGTDMRLSNDKFDYHALRASVNLRF